jgi:RNA polymerase primary sigma factor
MAQKPLQIAGDTIISHANDKKNYNRYINEVAKFQVLTTDEEVEYFTKLRQGETKYFDLIAKRNLRFVISIAKRYQNTVVATSTISLEDLISEGNIGLCTAINKFDHTMGFKFISYAVHYIRQTMGKCIQDHIRTIRIPSSKQLVYSRLKKLENELLQVYEMNTIPAIVLQEHAINKEIIKEDYMCSVAQIYTENDFEASLDKTFNKGTNHENEATLKDIISDESFESGDVTVLRKEREEFLQKCLTEIPTSVAEMFNLFYGLNGQEPMMLKEIGKRFDRSGETVRLTLKRWGRKIRRHYQNEFDKQYA